MCREPGPDHRMGARKVQENFPIAYRVDVCSKVQGDITQNHAPVGGLIRFIDTKHKGALGRTRQGHRLTCGNAGGK
jgi:hypothetical protein